MMIYIIFHASNVLLQQQYRECNFTRYSELISCLLVAEQNNELLMKNHQSRPTSSTPFPEANGNSFCGNKGKPSGKNLWRRKKSTLFLCVFICFRIASLKPCKGKPSGKNLSEGKRVQSA
jgi:hypothetical protein